MADYTSRTVTTVRREFTVPTRLPWGAPADEVGKAWAAAEREYRTANKIAEDQPVAGDALRFLPGDDEIVIAFTLSETHDA
ncbi:hypothetical protein ACIQU5_28015 [Streptomyces sp. NPDC090306]|uniref:hypothetical protein n=1 Tax=Streptomyces sp. NPDC090306 TaxID=3365961 RepID=UPI00382464D0